MLAAPISEGFLNLIKLSTRLTYESWRSIVLPDSNIKIVTRLAKIYFFFSPYPAHFRFGKFRLTASLWSILLSTFTWSNVLLHLILNISWFCVSFLTRFPTERWQLVVMFYFLTVYVVLMAGCLRCIWLKSNLVFLFNSSISMEAGILKEGKYYL